MQGSKVNQMVVNCLEFTLLVWKVMVMASSDSVWISTGLAGYAIMLATVIILIMKYGQAHGMQYKMHI